MSRLLGFGIGLWVVGLVSTPGHAQLIGNQYRAFSGQFQQYVEIDAATGGASLTSALFEVTGGVLGMTASETTVYGAELDDTSQESYLIEITNEPFPRGNRVGANPIATGGIIEALAYDAGSGQLVGALWDTSHFTDLYTIDPDTGEGTLVGRLSLDVVVVGMTFADGLLYAVTKAFDTRNAAFYTINPSTASETLIAELSGLDPADQGFGPLESLAFENGTFIGGWKALWSIDPGTAEGTLIGGNFATTDGRDGLFGLTAPLVGVPVLPTSWSALKRAF